MIVRVPAAGTSIAPRYINGKGKWFIMQQSAAANMVVVGERVVSILLHTTYYVLCYSYYILDLLTPSRSY